MKQRASGPLFDLLNRFFVLDPRLRMTLHTLARHPWLQEADPPDLQDQLQYGFPFMATACFYT